ncbi:MAG: TonB-dependent receptor, partial [Woeseiaceae bacterium]
MQRTLYSAALSACIFTGLAFSATLAAEGRPEGNDEITEITVRAERVANTRPAGTYASPITTLRFDPLTEVQSRGIAEGQSDVTVRGGVFENTGFKLGAVTVMDPQTGHYAAGLAIDPEFLSPPGIYKGIDNAIVGFNSAIATIAYGIRRVTDGGSVSLGAGSDDLNYQSLQFARTTN